MAQSSRIAGGVLAAIVAVAIVLRLNHLGTESLSLDEAASWQQSRDTLVDLFQRTTNDAYPPLHGLILFATMQFGDSAWMLRAPSALLGIANVVVIYWLGALTVGRTAGLAAVGLLAFSWFHLFYSQDATAFALMAASASLYAAASFYYLRDPSTVRAACIALAGLALVYSHPAGVLNALAIGGAFAVFEIRPIRNERRTVARWLLANAAVALQFLPWAVIAFAQVQTPVPGGIFFSRPTVSFISGELLELAGGALMALLLGTGATLAIIGRRTRGVGVLAVWAAGPILFAIVASPAPAPMLTAEFAIASLPPLFVLAGFGLTRHAHGRARYAMGAVVVVLAGVAFVRAGPYSPVKDDFRRVAAVLSSEHPGECAIVTPRVNTLPLAYYGWTSKCLIAADSAADIEPLMVGAAFVGTFPLPLSPSAAGVVDAVVAQGFKTANTEEFRGLQVISFTRDGVSTAP